MTGPAGRPRRRVPSGHVWTEAAKQERGQGAFGRQLPTFRRNADWRTTAIKRANTGAV